MTDEEKQAYQEEPVPEIVFTHAELDMLYYAALVAIDHPVAEQYDFTDEGLHDLLRALARISEWEEAHSEPEPMVVSPE